MSNTISQLEQQIADAREQLIETLAAGGNTTELRADIAKFTEDLEQARLAGEKSARVARKTADADVAQAGATIADAAHTELQASIALDGLEAVIGEPIPAIERDAGIDLASKAVATATVALNKATAKHTELVTAANRLSSALSAKQEALVELKRRRVVGKTTPQDGVEALGLPDDIADLERALADATQKAASALPTAERAAVERAQQELRDAVCSVKLRALRDRMTLVETAFLQSYRDLRAAEQASSEFRSRPSGAYRANAELKSIIARH